MDHVIAGVRDAHVEGQEDSRVRLLAMHSPAHEAAIRLLNLAVAVASFLALFPAMVVIGTVIKLDSKGPMIYRQLRVGLDRRNAYTPWGRRRSATKGDSAFVGQEERRDLSRPVLGRRHTDVGGRPFVMHKFRTMRTDAEVGTGPTWAAPTDGRTTKVGAWLRRYRLDEMPQFWNVLAGDMSVVGPRPERPWFVKGLRRQIAAYSCRQCVLPGITGWAQVNQPADQTFDDVRHKLAYDLEYIGRRSFAFECRIMLRTLAVMMRPEPPAAALGGVEHAHTD